MVVENQTAFHPLIRFSRPFGNMAGGCYGAISEGVNQMKVPCLPLESARPAAQGAFYLVNAFRPDRGRSTFVPLAASGIRVNL
jgi:hypothetical protein